MILVEKTSFNQSFIHFFGDPLGPLLFAAALQPLAHDLRSKGLDLAVHYLDDGVLAGDLAAVAAALDHVQREAGRIGLHLNLAKCEAVAIGPTQPSDLGPHFPAPLLRHLDGTSRVLHNFEFLGAAIGEDAFCEAHNRACKAEKLLEALAALADPQVGVRLLRSCAGFARMVQSMRGSKLTGALLKQAWRLVPNLTPAFPPKPSWHQRMWWLPWPHSTRISPVVTALLWTQRLVARNVSFLSVWIPHPGQTSFPHQAPQSEPPFFLNAGSGPGLSLPRFLLAKRRWRSLSSWARCVCGLALRMLLRTPGAPAVTAFSIAFPTTQGSASLAGSGPNGTMPFEMWSLLGPTRLACGLKKNALDCCFRNPHDTQSGRRRPADVFLPALAGGPAALDFAITAHQRQDILALASSKAGAAAESYARQKETHLNTAQACASQGVAFVPMAVETSGHWDAGAARVLRHIAMAVAARTGEDADGIHNTFVQELCVVVHSFRARAALRRRSEFAAQ
eukprot:s1901_g12.t1